MTRSKLYVIPGDPTPLARARINFKARRVYDSQQHIKLITGISIREQHNNEPYFEGAISLSATFYMPMPTSSWTLKKKKCHGGQIYDIRARYLQHVKVHRGLLYLNNIPR